MDTKEKNREGSRQRRPREEQRRQRPAPEERTGKAAKASAPKAEQARRRPPAEAEQKSRQRRQPDKEKTRQRPEQPRQAEPARQARAERRTAEQPAQRRRAPQQRQEAPRRRERQDEIPFAVPKGTGPQKSAPQPTAQEAEALRRRRQTQTVKEPVSEKKNALQNFISGIKGEPAPEGAAAKSEKRRAERAKRAEKQRKSAQRYDTPTVIYTEPMAFNRDRLLLQLLTVTAVVAAFVVGMSVFFKVGTVEVIGAEKYSSWSIREASGIMDGDNLLTFSKPKAAAKIQAELSYVNDVRIGIKLPDKVIIYVEEADVSYAIASLQGDWWLINSGGKVVEQLDSGLYSNYTQVLGVVLEDPQVGNPAVAANVVQETLESGEPAPITVTGEQRLSSALQILKALEANDIVGEAASVDVTALDDVRLWYGSRYEVLLGDTTRMEYKIACMNDAILQMSDYQSGILDISFTHWLDQVGYTPFG